MLGDEGAEAGEGSCMKGMLCLGNQIPVFPGLGIR